MDERIKQTRKLSIGDDEQIISKKRIEADSKGERDVESKSLRVVETKSGLEFKVWRNDKGELCIGNDCFHMRPDFAEGAIIAEFDTDNPTCPVDLKEATNAFKELLFEGAPTIYRKRRTKNV